MVVLRTAAAAAAAADGLNGRCPFGERYGAASAVEKLLSCGLLHVSTRTYGRGYYYIYYILPIGACAASVEI